MYIIYTKFTCNAGVIMPRVSYQQILDNEAIDADLSLVRWDDDRVRDFFLTVLPANKSIERLDLRHGALNDGDFPIILEGIKSRAVELKLLNLDHNQFTAEIYDDFVKLIESNKVRTIYLYANQDIFTDEQKDILEKLAKPKNVRLSFINSLKRTPSHSFLSEKQTTNSKYEERKDFSTQPFEPPKLK
jgi:hypothetical protein